MTNKSTNIQLKSLTSTISRFSAITFLVIVVSGLIYCVVALNGILDQSTYTDNQTNVNSASISVDQETINSLAALKTYDDNQTAKTLPSGRINPFSE